MGNHGRQALTRGVGSPPWDLPLPPSPRHHLPAVPFPLAVTCRLSVALGCGRQ